MAMDSSALPQIANKKKRLLAKPLSTWSWPPDSPAKSYLKVSIFGNEVYLLWKDYAC